MQGVNPFRKKIDEILELKKERNFISGMLLGMYGIIMMASMLHIATVRFLGNLDNPILNSLENAGALIIIGYIVAIVFSMGKEIIYLHIRMFDLINKITMWLFNKYTSKYYKKYKKDPPALDRMSTFQGRYFKWFYRLAPEIRKKVVYTFMVGWLIWAVLDVINAYSIVGNIIAEWVYEMNPWNDEGIK